MANKKKVTTAIVAGVTAVALLLGGTFAWQSINQTALNEAEAVVNPGGRLHDDFDGSNKDVYVENFADENIFARVRLDEYFEITVYGNDPQVITTNAVKEDKDTWVPHQFGDVNDTDPYWDWTTGGSTVFMPTFNKNKDSLVADVNGTYEGPDGIVTEADDDDRYKDNVQYVYGQKLSGDAIYDYDGNSKDELGEDLDNWTAYPNNVTAVTEEHTAKYTLNATLISMTDWLAMVEENSGYDVALHGGYWVYDDTTDDGWVYWSAPIEPGTATGLLLDGIKLDNKMSDSWYYGINVIGQFITADDLGDGTADNPGFMADGVSDSAMSLLEAIGAVSDGDVPEIIVPDENATVDIAIHSVHSTDVDGTYNWDTANYLDIGETYRVYVKVEKNDGTIVTDGASLSVDVTARKYDGTELSLTQDIDYTFSFDATNLVDPWPNNDEEEKAYLMGELVIEDTVPYGTWIDVTATIASEEVRGTGSNSLIVTEALADLAITLYDAESNKVTGAVVKENTTYDVVATLNYGEKEYTVFSTDETKWPVSESVAKYYDENNHYVVHCYAFEEEALTVDDDGKISMGTNDPEFLGEFTPAITIDDLQILDESGEPTVHIYAYGQFNYYFEGEFPLSSPEVSEATDNYWDYDLEDIVHVVKVADLTDRTMTLYCRAFDEAAGKDFDITDAIWEIVSDVEEGTSITQAIGTESAKLTLAENENATRIVIKVTSETHSGQGYLYIDLDYDMTDEGETE